MGSPFDSGKTLVFKTMSTSGSKCYMDSSPGASKGKDSVFLGDSIDYTKHAGAHWEAIKQPDGSYHLKTMASSSNKRFLDSKPSNSKDDSVYLQDDSAGDGSYWIPIQLYDGSYSLHSEVNSAKCYINSNPKADKEDSVWLDYGTGDIGTHWMVGVDYYTMEEIQTIINSNYPRIAYNCNVYTASTKFGSLDYNLLYGIWKDSGLGKYQGKGDKFSTEDYAVIMKGQVSEYSYNQKLPNDYGSLCGIMWATDRSTDVTAFNFTIDPFGNLILFQPWSGDEVNQKRYTPVSVLI